MAKNQPQAAVSIVSEHRNCCHLTPWGINFIRLYYPNLYEALRQVTTFVYIKHCYTSDHMLDFIRHDFTDTLLIRPCPAAPTNWYELWVELDGEKNTIDTELWGTRYYTWWRVANIEADDLRYRR